MAGASTALYVPTDGWPLQPGLGHWPVVVKTSRLCCTDDYTTPGLPTIRYKDLAVLRTSRYLYNRITQELCRTRGRSQSALMIKSIGEYFF